MASIEDYIWDIYSQREVYVGKSWQGDNRNHTIRYLEIPTDSNIFEMPVIALSYFRAKSEAGIKNEYSNVPFIFKFEYKGTLPRYKTVSRTMQDALRIHRNLGLMKVKTREDDDIGVYYVGHGIILDNSFNPIMMSSWTIEKNPRDEVTYYIKKRPILRISPHCFCNPVDNVQKLIVKKLPSAIFNNFQNSKLIVEESPFRIKESSKPSISTSSESLLKTALDHIDDIFI